MDVKSPDRKGRFIAAAHLAQQELTVCLGPHLLDLSHQGGWAGWASLLRLVSHPLLEEMLLSPSWTGEPRQRERPEAPVLLLSGGHLVGSLGISRTSGPDALPYSKYAQIKDSEVRNRRSMGARLGHVAWCSSDVAVSKPAFWLDM